ncbi:unnamed protein product [Effrenium voratum]|uniref:Uncharacterized protein n=1 Tax=Effrenium voratum TaxID=2562239 RepID=A0AA36J8M5_9DINO|nr:unnamed protein product [Effrenium voratum]CAJ1426413.1 unnamed protein product [Effrenium voratum]
MSAASRVVYTAPHPGAWPASSCIRPFLLQRICGPRSVHPMAKVSESMSQVLTLLGAAVGPLELSRLGLCSRGLGRQVFEPSFPQRLCRHLRLQDPGLDLEMLSICLALRSLRTRTLGRKACEEEREAQ